MVQLGCPTKALNYGLRGTNNNNNNLYNVSNVCFVKCYFCLFSLWAPIHVVLFNTIIFLLSMSHLKAVLSDPGTVPLPQNRLDFSDLHASSGHKNGHDHGEWTVCTRCETYRPPRAHHCRICKRCIRRMDHHCPWINNCVGERNQKYFLQFLIYVGILALYSIALVLISWVYPCVDCNMNLADSQARM